MSYANLTLSQMFDLAHNVPMRTEVQNNHTYVTDIRTLEAGDDVIDVPASHKKMLDATSHEGSLRLALRIDQGAAWLSRASKRFSILPGGIDDVIQRGASAQERFARNGERELARGTGLHNWEHETNRDLFESGISIVRQNPLRGYYESLRETPQKLSEGARLTEVMTRSRVDPATFSHVEDVNGGVGVVVIRGERQLGEIAESVGLEAAQVAFGAFDFGKEVRSQDDPNTWGDGVRVTTAEVWGENTGALFIIDGPNGKKKPNFTQRRQGTLTLADWTHDSGRPPFYIAKTSGSQWHSPLDEMVHLTSIRNWTSTIRLIQASGAVFRHWQLVDVSTGESLDLGRFGATAPPEHVVYDLSKPPPNMGPGTSWVLAPFELIDINELYASTKLDHENAGASVARLMGQAVNANTAVGTADALDEQAPREFSEVIAAKEGQSTDLWTDTFRHLKNNHLVRDDRVWVFDMKRDITATSGFAQATTALTKEQIVSEHITVTLDTRSRLAKIADFRMAVEMIQQKFMDYGRAVEQGLIPGVDDAEAEIQAIFVSEADRLEALVDLQVVQQNAIADTGLITAAEQETPGFLGTAPTDRRGTGTDQGPDNVSNTGVDAGGSDTTAGRAA